MEAKNLYLARIYQKLQCSKEKNCTNEHQDKVESQKLKAFHTVKCCKKLIWMQTKSCSFTLAIRWMQVTSVF